MTPPPCRLCGAALRPLYRLAGGVTSYACETRAHDLESRWQDDWPTEEPEQPPSTLAEDLNAAAWIRENVHTILRRDGDTVRGFYEADVALLLRLVERLHGGPLPPYQVPDWVRREVG